MKEHYMYGLAADVKQYATEEEKQKIDIALRYMEQGAISSIETLMYIMNVFKK